MSWNVEDSKDGLRLSRGTQMSFYKFWLHKGWIMIIYPSASHCPSHGVNSFRTTQLSVQRASGEGSCMIHHQANCSEFSPLPAVIHFCSHSDGVSVRLNNDCSSYGLVIPTRSICIPRTSVNFLYSHSTGHWGHHRNRGSVFEGSIYSTGPSSTHISRDSWLVDTEGLLCCK